MAERILREMLAELRTIRERLASPVQLTPATTPAEAREVAEEIRFDSLGEFPSLDLTLQENIASVLEHVRVAAGKRFDELRAEVEASAPTHTGVCASTGCMRTLPYQPTNSYCCLLCFQANEQRKVAEGHSQPCNTRHNEFWRSNWSTVKPHGGAVKP